MKTKLFVLLALFALSNCASPSSTDAELASAQSSLSAAQLGFDLAEILYVSKVSDPKTDKASALTAKAVLEKARERLTAEQARVAKIQLDRAQAAANASALILPAP